MENQSNILERFTDAVKIGTDLIHSQNAYERLLYAIVPRLGYGNIFSETTNHVSEIKECYQTLKNCAEHGAEGGYTGFISYHQTGIFYDEFKEDIWTLLTEQSEGSEASNTIEFINGFNGAKNVTDLATFENLLTWFALEETARYFTDGN